MGVARCRVGRAGREGAGCWAGWLPTALAFGEGGMERPSLGVRAPPPAFLAPPPRAGRRRGAGGFMVGMFPPGGVGDDRVGTWEKFKSVGHHSVTFGGGGAILVVRNPWQAAAWASDRP